MSIRGLYTAIVTPFADDFSLDLEGLKRNVDAQIQGGVDGLVVLGTTGENPTLSQDERRQVIEACVQQANGRIQVMVGVGTNNTQSTVENSKVAQDCGADSLLVVTPYYNKPTQRGIVKHFEAVAKESSLPIMIYNIKGRTATNIETPTIAQLAEIETVVSVKESSGDMAQIAAVIDSVARKRDDFTVLSGDDYLSFNIIALGGAGAVSVTSNLLPEKMASLCKDALAGNFERARETHFELLPLFETLFIETSPSPLKAAMNTASLAAGPCRLPLCELEAASRAQLLEVLQQYGIQS